MFKSNALKHFINGCRNKSSNTMARSVTSNLNVNTADLPFARAKFGPFLQEQPVLGNQFLNDALLQSYLKRHMPEKVFEEIKGDLKRFGHRVASEIYDLGIECERVKPTLEKYNAWGERIDEIRTCDAWKTMKSISAEEGLIAIAYERKYAQHSRLYQMAKGYLFGASSGLYNCPLAMTDGAASTIEKIGKAGLLSEAYEHLISRDPSKFWTSGQWMTERGGGSDVANGCETLAVAQDDGSYKLYGYKWFSSATDADMTLTLARVVDANGETTSGTRGLSMFYLNVRNPDDGKLNDIEVVRLKDKLGTRQLPTAELLLDGTRAYRISAEGRGVAAISSMLTISRLHNSVMSVSNMRRILNLAKDYSTRRTCFGKQIKDHSLHIRNLANMEVETRAAFMLSFELIRYQGLEENGLASEDIRDLLRLLTPISKLYTAKQVVANASEGVEAFGGQGYLEDSGIPTLFRDAQVLPIWEGTTNILSLDVLRALAKSQGRALVTFVNDVHRRIDGANVSRDLEVSAAKVKQAANQIQDFAVKNMANLEPTGREFAYSLARTYMGMLLVEHACWKGASESDVFTANRWCSRDLVPVLTCDAHAQYENEAKVKEHSLVFDSFNSKL